MSTLTLRFALGTVGLLLVLTLSGRAQEAPVKDTATVVSMGRGKSVEMSCYADEVTIKKNHLWRGRVEILRSDGTKSSKKFKSQLTADDAIAECRAWIRVVVAERELVNSGGKQ
jgi:hypothetical protein